MRRATVTVVNPEQLSLPAAAAPRPKGKARGKRGRSKKKTTAARAATTTEVGCMTTKRNARGQFVKKGGKRRKKRRTSNPSPAPRRSSGGSRRRRRRRSNPEGESPRTLGGAFREATSLFIPKMMGKLATSWVVKRFGADWGTGVFGQQTTSGYAGQGWPLTNYVIGAAVGYVGGMLLDTMSRRGGRMRGWGRAFSESVYDDLIQRFFYTEVIARSEWGVKNFGQVDFIPNGWEDDVYGNRWATFPDSRYQQTMLGLESAGPMDGVVTAGPMDGLVRRSPRYDRRPVRARPMGHYEESPWLMQGSHDPYAAAYM